MHEAVCQKVGDLSARRRARRVARAQQSPWKAHDDARAHARRRTRSTPSGAHRGSSRGQDHIGAETAKLAEAILAGRPHPEQGHRPCLRPCAAESSIRSGRARAHAASIAGRLRMLTPRVGSAGRPQRAKKTSQDHRGVWGASLRGRIHIRSEEGIGGGGRSACRRGASGCRNRR